jgi:hypothetical protein
MGTISKRLKTIMKSMELINRRRFILT